MLIPALILYAMEKEDIKSESRFNALLIAYAFLVPLNIVLDKYEEFITGTIGTMNYRKG